MFFVSILEALACDTTFSHAANLAKEVLYTILLAPMVVLCRILQLTVPLLPLQPITIVPTVVRSSSTESSLNFLAHLDSFVSVPPPGPVRYSYTIPSTRFNPILQLLNFGLMHVCSLFFFSFLPKPSSPIEFVVFYEIKIPSWMTTRDFARESAKWHKKYWKKYHKANKIVSLHVYIMYRRKTQ